MIIAGVDEVGRGAWAGPIVAASVILRYSIDGLADSKQLTPRKRQFLSEIIKRECLAWSIAEISASEIDQMGLREANRLVMRLAVNGLSARPSKVIVDGFSCGLPNEEVIIKGDQKIAEIMAASIIAKVYRDELMADLHLRDNRYGFDRHVGYGTPYHLETIKQYGPSVHHRRSFKPIASIVNGESR